MTESTMILRRSVTCPTCRYDLNGLEIGGLCPECRTPVRHAVAATIDPYGSSLPPIENPRLVGTALVFFSACAILVCLALWIPWAINPHLGVAADVQLIQLPSFLSWVTTPWVLLVGAAGLLGGVWAAMVLRPRHVLDEGPRVRRHLWTIAVACTIGAILSVAISLQQASVIKIDLDSSPTAVYLICQLPLLICCGGALLGFRGVLIHVGERSRVFREGGRSRQRIPDLLVALGVMTVALGLAQMGRAIDVAPLQVIGRITSLLCGLMLLLGLIYLHCNTWWIRNAILTPPPTLDELMTEAESDVQRQ